MAHSQPTGTIGFVAPYVSGIYFGNVLAGAGQAARRHGLRLLAFQESLAEMSRARLAWDQVEGWIVVLNTAARSWERRVGQAASLRP
jgi:DNA-binding LacI/PurR family transcriptional regulator